MAFALSTAATNRRRRQFKLFNTAATYRRERVGGIAITGHRPATLPGDVGGTVLNVTIVDAPTRRSGTPAALTEPQLRVPRSKPLLRGLWAVFVE